ncbi:MFS transporter [Actinospica sp. MGRD01-02]|uniref:MFS transporter n=1 Tax=Actinospica acidithermotolerans TaxID=2828514 RepID=A0A941ED13_9ACTN|nr:MFS transporter [Actinospica acidithermotolerans]MBR7828213.1 MFS transporter [Actinospica acidithermotolerans]
MSRSENDSAVLSRVEPRAWPRLLVTERPRPEVVRTHPAGWRLAVATVCFGAFMGQLDASVVTLAYPALRTEFHSSLAAVEWVSLAYLLALAALLVPVGRLSDAHGRKLMYLYGFLVFTAASAACGLAPDLPVLIAMRAVQAAGAALLQANSVALVTTSAPPGRMRAALGMQAGAQALGLALGPTLGGLIVTAVGWRWIFLVNVPIGLIALPAGHYLLPRTRTRMPTGDFDRTGLALLATASSALLLGISAISGLDLPVWALVCCFTAAVAAAAGFAHHLRTASDPLVDPMLLRRRRISTGLAGALGGYLVLFGPLVLVPVVLTARGASLTAAGLAGSALPVGFAVAALAAERVLPAALSDRGRALLGAGIACAGLCALAAVPPTPLVVPGALAVAGLGLGVFMPANNALVMSAIPVSAAGTGGGLVNMTRALGTALGVALVTLALHAAGSADRVLGNRLAGGLLALAALATWAVTALQPSGPQGTPTAVEARGASFEC